MAVGSIYGARIENGTVIGCGVINEQLAPQVFNGVRFSINPQVCAAHVAAAEAAARNEGRPAIVLWASTWESSALITNGLLGPETLKPGSARWNTFLTGRIEQRLRTLAAGGAKVVMLEEPAPVDTPDADAGAAALVSLQKRLAAEHPGQFKLLNLAGLVCPPGPPCPAVVAGRTLRPDKYHYSPSTSLWVANWLVPRVLAAR